MSQKHFPPNEQCFKADASKNGRYVLHCGRKRITYISANGQSDPQSDPIHNMYIYRYVRRLTRKCVSIAFMCIRKQLCTVHRYQ